MSAERIIMAAWKEGDAIYTVERPGRHHNVAWAMRDNGRLLPGKPLYESGFITSTGRFVDRKEGFRIADYAGQIAVKHGPSDQLFSEDMW